MRGNSALKRLVSNRQWSRGSHVTRFFIVSSITLLFSTFYSPLLVLLSIAALKQEGAKWESNDSRSESSCPGSATAVRNEISPVGLGREWDEGGLAISVLGGSCATIMPVLVLHGGKREALYTCCRNIMKSFVLGMVHNFCTLGERSEFPPKRNSQTQIT